MNHLGLRTRAIAAVIAVIGLGLTAGCSGTGNPKPTVTETPVVEPSKTDAPAPPDVDVWPLTGVHSGQIVERPAVAVKIENTAAARPQTGLNEADVVWETIIEFDVSRLLAVFHSNYPEIVGPIRSVRPVDMRIYSPLEPVFVFSGGQQGILELVRRAPGHWLEENRGASQMWRDHTRNAPHNLYGSVPGLAELATDVTAPPSEQFEFAPDLDQAVAVTSGAVTNRIELSMSPAAQPNWTWNNTANAWLRNEGSQAAMTSGGAQVQATNVVILEVKAVPSGFTAQNNASVPDDVLEGEGNATIATGGKTIAATWHKADQNSPLTLQTAAGEPALLAPGNTWVEVLPQPNGTFTLSP